jgi:hypothetical protein
MSWSPVPPFLVARVAGPAACAVRVPSETSKEVSCSPTATETTFRRIGSPHFRHLETDLLVRLRLRRWCGGPDHPTCFSETIGYWMPPP